MEHKLQHILKNSFAIRIEHKGRRTGRVRVVEVTYYWNGSDQIILSGYPGRRDWVANMSSDPTVTIYTVEGNNWYQIPGQSRVIVSRSQRNHYILKYLDRWNRLPGNRRSIISLVIKSIQLKEKLHMPWWGPFYFVQKIFDKMPCVEIILNGTPEENNFPPPSASPIKM